VYPNTVHKIDLNSAGYGVFQLDGLENNDVYLVRVKGDRIAYNASALPLDVPIEHERVVGGSRAPAGTITLSNGEKLVVHERQWQVVTPDPAESVFNRSVTYSLAAAKVGDTKSFYVDVSPNSSSYELKSAVLKKIGEYCKVWVIEENFSDGPGSSSTVNQTQVDALAKNFDAIYPIETNILGYEYGGGPGGNGGVDGDSQIQILVFDIDGDASAMGGSVTLGYFYPGDEYKRGSTYPYSNEAEIFYLDSVMMNDPNSLNAIYSTLIHEFNHMINFNIKVLMTGHIQSWNSEVWYTEMLSMLAEDTIGPYIGIAPAEKGHVIFERIPKWLENYTDVSVMYWPSSTANALAYYASNYAFGAYLVRNFGGPALFSAIAKSYATGRASIDACLRSFNGREVDTAYALERFGEALVYSGDAMPNNVFSFDKTVQGFIGGKSYTFEKFDIWNISVSYYGMPNAPQGPVVRSYDRLNDYSISSNVVQLYKDTAWKSVSGRINVLLQNVDTSSKYLLMIR
jgi:hypothetical protein